MSAPEAAPVASAPASPPPAAAALPPAGPLPSTSLEMVLIPPEGTTSKVKPNPAYVAGSGLFRKAVIVLHEWWGVTPAVQKQAVEWFASDFLVVVLDLFRGSLATNVGEAAHLMQSLDFTQALRDIRATAKYVREKEQCTKVGLIGFSMSGAIALAAAVHLKDIHAAVVLYGIPDRRFAQPSTCRIPLQLHFAANDVLPNFSDPKSAAQLEEALKEGNVEHEFYRYPSAGHSFCAPVGHTDPIEKAAASKVKERALAFFIAKLA